MSVAIGLYQQGINGDWRPPEEVTFAVIVADDASISYIASTADDSGDETTPILKQG